MTNPLKRFVEDITGVTTVEYALAGSLLTVALLSAFLLLSGGIKFAISDIASALSGTP